MSVNAVSGEEEALRGRLLASFRQYATAAPNVIHASKFQAVLAANNLPFGHQVVDRIMLLCHIDDTGMVDISRFAEVVELAGQNIENDSSGFAQPKLHSDLHQLSQADRVRRLAGDIHALFYKFDSGSGSLEEFRMAIKKLGISETHETRRLLRQTPISFRELLHSLTQTTHEISPDIAAGVSRSSDPQGTSIGGTGHLDHGHFTRKGAGTRRTREKVMHDSDVITWSNDNSKPFHSHRAHGKYYHDTNETHFRTAWGALKKSAVADLMVDTDDHHFETTQQHAEQEGLNLQTGPGTSAGYSTVDRGLVREQIYSSIRQLDQGSLTSKEFRTRLAQLGIGKLPPDAKKLVHQYECHGRVDFTKFVRAFEDYFRSATVHTPSKAAMPPRPPSPAQLHAAGSVGHFQKAHITAIAGTDHGDIISWAKGASTSDEQIPGETRQHDATGNSFMMKMRGLRDSQTNILAWGGKPISPRRHKAAGSPPKGDHASANIITWDGARPLPPQRPQKLMSAVATAAQNKGTPYGTVKDEQGVPNLTWATGSRKARVGPRAPTGGWFNPVSEPEPAPQHHQKRMMEKPLNLQDHIGKGYAVGAEEFHSGKKQFGGQMTSTGGVDHFYMPEAPAEAHNKKLFTAREWAPDNVNAP